MTAFGAGTVRAIWNRPLVDWSLSGAIGWPSSSPESSWMEGKGLKFSNFGDGPAHRVAVHIHRGNAKLSQVLTTAPMIDPGEAIEFTAGVSAEHWDSSYLWITWTQPPIRRHRERSSARLLMPEHLDLTDYAKDRLERYRTDD